MIPGPFTHKTFNISENSKNIGCNMTNIILRMTTTELKCYYFDKIATVYLLSSSTVMLQYCSHRLFIKLFSSLFSCDISKKEIEKF